MKPCLMDLLGVPENVELGPPNSYFPTGNDDKWSNLGLLYIQTNPYLL